MGLGPLRDVSMATARELAKRYRNIKRSGRDPIAERARERSTVVPTFRACAEGLIESKRPEWRNVKHAQQWTNTLETYVNPLIGPLPVDAVTSDHVLRILRPIWVEKTETATRVRQRIEAVLDYATAMKHRSDANPARWHGNLDKLLASPAKLKRRKVRHYPALPYRELPAFMHELSAQKGIVARTLAFVILTAARTGEARGAVWSEIDGDVWTIPATRMKAERVHRIPLSRATLEIVENLPRLEGYLFPGQRKGAPLSNGSLPMVLKRMGRTGITVHGFRSTFRDWCAEQTNFPRELCELALAHSVKGRTEEAYWRTDVLEKRRKLAEAWAAYCLPVAVPGVVVLHSKRI
jgi:integrase